MAAETPREAMAEALHRYFREPSTKPLDLAGMLDATADAILASLPAGWSLARTPSDLPDAPNLGDGEDGRELRLLREALRQRGKYSIGIDAHLSGSPVFVSVYVGTNSLDDLQREGPTIASAARACRERLGAGR